MNENELERVDSLTHIERELEHLSQTMFVIYEGLYTGGMVDESPHCILVLQTAVEEILKMVHEEQQRLRGAEEPQTIYNKEGHEDV